MTYQRLTADDLIDRAEVVDTVHRYASGIDRCDWTMYRSIFADEVLFDFSSWSGAPAAPMAADDWVARVGGTLSLFDSTQHLLSNHRITLDGDAAQCVTYMIALHHLVTGDVREMHAIGGFYTNRLKLTDEGWRIVACTLTVTWEMGDRGLFQRAADRGRRRPAGKA